MAERVDDLLERGNGWAERIRDRVIHLAPELTALVLHLGQAGTFWDWHYKVDAAWKRQTKALLKTDGARELVTEAVRALAADSSLHDCTDPNVTWQDLGAKSDRTPTRDLANGFALAAGYLTRGASPAELEGLVADLLTVARKNAHVLDGYYKRDDDLCGAVFTALADLSAMEALWTLHREVQPGAHSHRHLAKMVKKTATRIGVPPHQLQERTVLTHGVQADGTLRLGWIGRGAVWLNIPYEALIAISHSGRVTVDWTDVDEGGTVTRRARLPGRDDHPLRHLGADHRRLRSVHHALSTGPEPASTTPRRTVRSPHTQQRDSAPSSTMNQKRIPPGQPT
ncbi:hypothetical protein PV726_40635 [Streptomyces europaeiscabiei]|uniref:hypothetical protein n=1 Tax=Streptomyces europaeiscabiei TaxID=146819 RepID=UPI0029BA2E30|nr:hypothetical protein [Streptomyces europaeiscabiei]MDX3696492.1 hypothetical protein [Streptomyces europaeiscabiei]